MSNLTFERLVGKVQLTPEFVGTGMSAILSVFAFATCLHFLMIGPTEPEIILLAGIALLVLASVFRWNMRLILLFFFCAVCFVAFVTLFVIMVTSIDQTAIVQISRLVLLYGMANIVSLSLSFMEDWPRKQ